LVDVFNGIEMIASGRFFLLLSLGFALANCGELRAGYVVDPAQPLQSQRFQLEYQVETGPIPGTRSDGWVLIPASTSARETPQAPRLPDPSVELPSQAVIAHGAGMNAGGISTHSSDSAGGSGLGVLDQPMSGGALITQLKIKECFILPVSLLGGVFRPPRGDRVHIFRLVFLPQTSFHKVHDIWLSRILDGGPCYVPPSFVVSAFQLKPGC
jgi:hypothetical protein